MKIIHLSEFFVASLNEIFRANKTNLLHAGSLHLYGEEYQTLSGSPKWSKFDSVFLRYSGSVYSVFMTPIRKIGTKEK